VSQIDQSKYKKQFTDDMEKLASMDALSDVVIICGGEKFKAHRAVLAARSPVFEAMFTHEMAEKSSGQVKIPNFKSNEMRDFLHFLYHAKLESFEHSVKLLDLADKYQVATLKELCVDHLMSQVTKDNAMEMLQLANLHNSDSLKGKAFGIIRSQILGASFAVPDDFVNKVKDLQKAIDLKQQFQSLINQ